MPKRKNLLAVPLLLAFAFCVHAGAARAQASEPMDDSGADDVVISCEDGTELHALFGDTSVEITLADGTRLTLPAKESDEGFSYSNGQYELSGGEEDLTWTVGRKTPVNCDIKDTGAPTKFDTPLLIDNKGLKPDPANPDAEPQVNCYRFDGFMVKEVDLGEKGAERLAITPQNVACTELVDKDEKPVKDDIAGYFLGAKGKIVFFQAADMINAGLPFVAFDSTTLKKLFSDSFEGDDFQELTVDGDKVDMKYRRSLTASCSLYKDAGACADELKKATGLGEKVPLPDCAAAYNEAIKASPKDAASLEKLPSVINYDAELKFDGTTATIVPLDDAKPVCQLPA